MNRLSRYLAFACVLIILAMIVPVGCRSQQPPAPSGIDLSTTLVPNLDLDAYVYIKQDKPTRIPGNAIGSPSDLNVVSLALWGIAKQEGFAVGGAVTFTNASDAAREQGQIPAQAGVWTAIADKTLYFVRGSGTVEETLKAAISRNDFKYYQDKDVLAELALLPNSANARPAATIVVKPNASLVKLLANHSSPRTTNLMNALVTYANLQTGVAALYSSTQLDVADLAQRLGRGTIAEADLGVLASVKSRLPGAVVGPLATGYLNNAGYTATAVGNLSLYKGSLNAAGKTIPVILSIEGNRIYVASSGKESYAQSLITGVKR